MSKKFKVALDEMRAQDLDTQTNGVDSLVGYIRNSITPPPSITHSLSFSSSLQKKRNIQKLICDN